MFYAKVETNLIKLIRKNVEIIHTDGDLFGFSFPIGTKDCYPNFGRATQPGTEFDVSGTLSHLRACDYFAETLLAKNTFIADKCTSYQKNACNVESTGYKMGGEPLTSGIYGVYYLTTNGVSPFGRNGQNTKSILSSLKIF